ncbi:hypothetical protein HGRIS_000761 [Hohenbuehelia grisea]|uniref:Uncharacterized protein n=1 Tax=Hohenbuehelia grisea TaxID=104357 RepID=A0ABR3IPM8_9AGAR
MLSKAKSHVGAFVRVGKKGTNHGQEERLPPQTPRALEPLGSERGHLALRRRTIHQPDGVSSGLSPEKSRQATGAQQRTDTFEDGAVAAFCNTIVLRGVVHSELLAGTLRFQLCFAEGLEVAIGTLSLVLSAKEVDEGVAGVVVGEGRYGPRCRILKLARLGAP